MGTVYKKTATKPLPAGAKIIVRKGQRLAEWIDAKGKRRTAPVTVGKDGADRIVVTTRTYTAKYRDGSGIVREVATGCRDESAARSILTDLEKRAARVQGKILTAAEDRMIDHQETSLADHLEAYLEHQVAKDINRVRVANTRRRLERLANACGFRRLADLEAVALERWLTARQAEGMGAGNRNEYRQELVAFGNWCVRNHRLLNNPFADVPKADAKADPRRKRRALTEGELRRLLYVARWRPLAEYGRQAVAQGQSRSEGQAGHLEETAADLRGPRSRKGPGPGAARQEPGSGRRTRPARPGTCPHLQDAGPDRAPPGRTGFAHRGATGARR